MPCCVLLSATYFLFEPRTHQNAPHKPAERIPDKAPLHARRVMAEKQNALSGVRTHDVRTQQILSLPPLTSRASMHLFFPPDTKCFIYLCVVKYRLHLIVRLPAMRVMLLHLALIQVCGSLRWIQEFDNNSPVTDALDRPGRRYDHASAAWEGKLYVSHGYHYVHEESRPQMYDDTWVFKPASGSWEQLRGLDPRAPLSTLLHPTFASDQARHHGWARLQPSAARASFCALQ